MPDRQASTHAQQTGKQNRPTNAFFRHLPIRTAMTQTPTLSYRSQPFVHLLFLALVMLSCLGLLAPLAAQADDGQDWPNRNIHLIVPFPGGSSPDLLARTLAEHLSNKLDRSVVVENKPGAGGNIGTSFVSRAKPDGYTLLVTINGPIVTAPTLYQQTLNYDPYTELQPISLIGTSPNVLVVGKDFPADNLSEFIAYAQAHPNELNYGTVGAGSASHLSMAMLEHEADIELQHIPYSSFPQIISALIAGDIQASFMVPGIAMPQVEAGEVRALAITSLEESPLLPNMPTVQDSGFDDFEAISWNALYVPAGTPDVIVDQLNALTKEILANEEVIERLQALYFTPLPSSPAEMNARVQDEKARWDAVINRLDLSLD